jgi:FkbM family methyltransferase
MPGSETTSLVRREDAFVTFRRKIRKMVDSIRSLRGVRVGGKHFSLPVGAAFAIEEPWMGDVLRLLLPHFDGDFVDVGANIGQTLLQLRAIDLKRRYVGFEPNPSCAAYIFELARLNRLDATDLVPVACGTEYGIDKLFFYQDSLFDSSASLVPDFRSGSKVTQSTYVVTVPGGECLAAAGIVCVGLIKIDVEGYEAKVVQAFEAEISKCRPCLIMEVLPVYSAENKSRLDSDRKIEEVVNRNNYTVFRIMKTPEGRFARFVLVTEFGIHGDMSLVDYVLLPNESVDQVVALGE